MESLLKDEELTTVIKDLIRGSGRSYPLKETESFEEKGVVVPEKKQVGNVLANVPQATKTSAIPKKETVAVS